MVILLLRNEIFCQLTQEFNFISRNYKDRTEEAPTNAEIEKITYLKTSMFKAHMNVPITLSKCMS